MDAIVRLDDEIGEDETLDLYRANRWSAADKPIQLIAALRGSSSLATARVDGRLVGLGNAISDGHLVVYYPHLLVHPEFHNQGIGKKIMKALIGVYDGFHQHMITADNGAVAFYRKLGFRQAGNTHPLWIYAGTDH